MYYRRKVLLALLQIFDGSLEKIRLQKLLFLFSQRQSMIGVSSPPCYDFIPYKYGCFSYSAYADLAVMVKKSILTEDDKQFFKEDSNDYFKQLKAEDKKYMSEVKILYGHMNSTSLIKHTYINYPFYAIYSEVAKNHLNSEEMKKVNSAIPSVKNITLFTIGYEGVSLEAYLTKLIKNDIKLLVDVRNNPLSMKYGFSKNQLKKYCEGVGIQYIHFPDVGIQSEQRQELNNQNDYDTLFEIYRKENLPKTQATQNTILNLLAQYQRIALTCFEAEVCQCHRSHLAHAITQLPGFHYELKHI